MNLILMNASSKITFAYFPRIPSARDTLTYYHTVQRGSNSSRLSYTATTLNALCIANNNFRNSTLHFTYINLLVDTHAHTRTHARMRANVPSKSTAACVSRKHEASYCKRAENG